MRSVNIATRERKARYPMDPAHKRTLRHLRMQLASDVCAEQVAEYLYQEEILTFEQLETIQTKCTTKEKAFYLLNELPKRGPRAFAAFLEALRQEKSEWLVDMLVKRAAEEMMQGDPYQRTLAEYPSHFLDSCPGQQEIGKIAASLGPECDRLGSMLGITEAQLHACRVTNPNNASSQAFAMLVTWHQGAGSAATRRSLCDAFVKAEIDLNIALSSFQHHEPRSM